MSLQCGGPRNEPRRIARLVLCATLVACKAEPDAPRSAPPRSSTEIVLGAESPKSAYIGTEAVTLRHERTVAVLPAQLVLDEAHTVRVTSPVSGRAQSVDVEPGATVRRGDVLARLISGDLAQAQSDVVKATAALQQSTASLARMRDLYDHHVVAAKDLEQAKSDEAQARAESDRAVARVRSLGEVGSEVGGIYVLRAPIGGVVVERALSAGTEVRTDAASPLFVIAGLDTLWLTASVSQRDLPSVRTGSRLEFTTEAAPNRRYLATVTYVSNSLDPATRTATIRATLPNPGGMLRAQTSGSARLLAPSAASLIVVPDAALVTQGAETVVFVVVGPGRYARRVVAVGDDDGAFATITAGLEAGDRIVTTGSLLLAAEADRLH